MYRGNVSDASCKMHSQVMSMWTQVTRQKQVLLEKADKNGLLKQATSNLIIYPNSGERMADLF